MSVRLALRMVTPRDWTGGLNYLLNMSRALRLYAPEFEVVFFAPPDIGPTTTQAISAAVGAPPVSLRERTHRDDIGALAGLQEREAIEAFKSAQIDLVLETTGYYGAQPPFKVISWLPDFQHRCLPHFFSARAWWTREMRFRSILRNRRHVILSSNDAKSDMLKYYGATRATAHVIPFAVSSDSWPTYAEGEITRRKYNLPEQFVYLPNQFWPHKNHITVIRALQILGDDAPVVAASGPHDPKARTDSILGQSDLPEKFQLLGKISHGEVLALNSRSHALLNPSLFEGWSTTVEEAKALATPLILSDLAVHREQVAGNAIFFDPRNDDDCARALFAAKKLRPRDPEAPADIQARNANSVRQFADRLRTAFLMALSQGDKL